MKTKYFILPIAFFYFVSCSSPDKKETEIKSLKESLGYYLTENAGVVRSMQVKAQGSPAAKSYFEFAERLNGCVDKFIDTSFSLLNCDSAKIISDLKNLNALYQKLLDSAQASGPRLRFLTDDFTFMKSTTFNWIGPFPKDAPLNYYLTAQQILYKHKQILKICEGTIGTGCWWFFQIENSGYLVNAIDEEKTSKIKLLYRYPNRYAKYKLLDLEKVTDAKDNSVKIISKKITEGDTLIITIEKMKNENYKAFVKYNVIKDSGEMTDKTIEFPFSGR